MSWTQSTQISREEPNYEKDVGVLDWESFFPSDDISGIGERVQQAVISDQSSSVTKSNRRNRNVDKLTPAVQKLMDGVVHLLHFKDDALVTLSVLPQLIQLLASSDPNQAHNGAASILSLAKKAAPKYALIDSKDLMPAFSQVLQDTNTKTHDETKKTVLAAITILSEEPKGRLAMFKGHTIQALVRMLGHPKDTIVKYALSTLYNLIAFNKDEVAGAIRLAGGVKRMSALISPKEKRPFKDKLHAIVCASLEQLCMGDVGSKVIVSEMNCIGFIIDAVKSSNYEKLRYAASRTLCSLSAYSGLKSEILGLDAVNGLISAFDDPSASEDMKESILWTIRNLSDRIEDDSEVIHRLIANCLVIISGDSNVVDSLRHIAGGILCNLTCNSEKNKVFVVENNGVRSLSSCILEASDSLSTKEPAICTLRHLTSRNACAEKARDQIADRHVVAELHSALKNFPEPDEQDVTYKRAALRLVRNLSLNKRCRNRMYELKLITQIYSLMTELSVAKEFEQFEIDDVIEACLSAIHVLCKDSKHRKLLMNNDPSGVVKTLVQLALAPSLNCKREALGALAELSQDSGYRSLIKSYESHISELMSIDVESVSVYAGYVLYQLDEDQKRTLRRKATIERKLEQMDQEEEHDDKPQNFARETQEREVTTGDSDV